MEGSVSNGNKSNRRKPFSITPMECCETAEIIFPLRRVVVLTWKAAQSISPPVQSVATMQTA
eukprot:5883029-Prymnesium_polylepis.2